MKTLVSTAALAGLLVLTGCGGGGDNDAQPSEDETVLYDESEVVEHIGLEEDRFGSYSLTLDDGTECGVAVVLTGKSSVDTYANAGDTVATNPEGTVGVKVSAAEEKTCYEAFTEALSDFP